MKVGIYIDADNTSFRICDNLMKKCSNMGDIYVKKIYSDWTKSESNNWKPKVLDYGLEAIQVFRMNRKQSTDIHLITDLIKDINNFSFLDTIVLLSSDSDFSHLCHIVNSFNMKIIIVGEESSVLRNYCNEFWPINNFYIKESSKTNLYIEDESDDYDYKKFLKKPFESKYLFLISEYKKIVKELLPKDHTLKLRKIEIEIKKYLPEIKVIYYNNRIYLVKVKFLSKYNVEQYNSNKDKLKNKYPLLFKNISEKKIISLLNDN